MNQQPILTRSPVGRSCSSNDGQTHFTTSSHRFRWGFLVHEGEQVDGKDRPAVLLVQSHAVVRFGWEDVPRPVFRALPLDVRIITLDLDLSWNAVQLRERVRDDAR